MHELANIQNISLWGRSMGAVTALLFCNLHDLNKRVSGIVLDSPFSSLKKLAKEHIDSKSPLPNITTNYIYSFIRKKILKKAKFDMDKISPIANLDSIKIPGFFITSKNDKIVSMNHVKKLYKKYKGDKCIVVTKQGHNSFRPDEVMKDTINFI